MMQMDARIAELVARLTALERERTEIVAEINTLRSARSGKTAAIEGLCSSIVDSVTSSRETAKLYRSLAQRPVNSRRRFRRVHLAPTLDAIGRAAGFAAQHLHASSRDAGFAPTQTQVGTR